MKDAERRGSQPGIKDRTVAEPHEEVKQSLQLDGKALVQSVALKALRSARPALQTREEGNNV